MARDRPSPYGKSGRSSHRSAGAHPPRVFFVLACSARACPSRSLDSCRMARDRPSPYAKTSRAECVARPFAIRRSQTTECRSAGACPSRALGLCRMARDRPPPYGKRGRSGYRSAGACPPRSSALRWQICLSRRNIPHTTKTEVIVCNRRRSPGARRDTQRLR